MLCQSTETKNMDMSYDEKTQFIVDERARAQAFSGVNPPEHTGAKGR
jgi:hypothetical protein